MKRTFEMADTKISALTDLTVLADLDRIALAEASALDVPVSCTLVTLRSYLQSLGGLPYIQRAGGITTTTVTSMTEVTDLTVALAAGAWRFEYWLEAQSGTLTNAFKFAVDHSGTTSTFVYTMMVMGNSAIAAVGAWDQEVNAMTGFVVSSFATRIKNTTLGPGTGVDTISANFLVRISGRLQSSTSGNLKLMVGSEVATNTTTVQALSTVLLYNLTNTV
jgi:hypothetical protein